MDDKKTLKDPIEEEEVKCYEELNKTLTGYLEQGQEDKDDLLEHMTEEQFEMVNSDLKTYQQMIPLIKSLMHQSVRECFIGICSIAVTPSMMTPMAVDMVKDGISKGLKLLAIARKVDM